MGACLLQEQNGVFRPVAFASRVLRTAERNYSAYLLEMAAATYAIEHFHNLLKGRRFYLYTDHKPLVDLSAVHRKTLNRLEEKRAEYEFDLRYTPGGHFNPADYLSRNITTTSQVCALTEEIAAYPATSWRDLQEQDDEITMVKKAMAKTGPWPPRFRKVAKQMAEQNGLVGFYLKPRRGFAKDMRFRVLPPKTMYKTLLQQAHDEATAGHGGQAATMERIRQQFWWPGIIGDVERHVARCKPCDSARSQRPTNTPTQPLPIPTRPNQRLHADLWGPHKDSDGNKKWVCVITDALTRLVQLTVIDDKSAHSAAKAMLDWVTGKGIPEEIVTDQGKEFCNELVKDLWERLKVRHTTTTPYHPRANGAAERFNATMDKFLRKLMVQDGRESGSWVEYIPSLMVAYNTKVHKGMRTSPFKAMYGYDPNSLYWANMDDVISDRTPVTSNDPLVRLDLDRQEIRNSVKDIMHLNQQHMLRESDRRVRVDKHRWVPRIGEKVWAQRRNINVPDPTRQQQWAPAVVLECTAMSVYRVSLTDMKRKNKRKYNLELLRPRRSAMPEDDITEDGLPIIEDGSVDNDNDGQTAFDVNAIQWAISEDIAETIQRRTQQLADLGIDWQWGWATTSTSATSPAETPRPTRAAPPPPRPPPPQTPKRYVPWPWTAPPTVWAPATGATTSTRTPLRTASAEESDTEQFFTPPEAPPPPRPRTRAAKGQRELSNLIWSRLFAPTDLTRPRLRSARK
jgi:hypothetical protein